MKIVVDENMPLAEAFFSGFGSVVRLPGRLITQQDLSDADALMVRSVTTVNEALLANTSVKFVGSATIGVDHIDLDYLDKTGISCASAPGCNADAVVNYVIASLLEIKSARGIALDKATVGIVGLGNVGSRLQAALKDIGISVLVCDPPKQLSYQRRGDTSQAETFSSLEEVLAADIVSFHVPKVTEGPFATHHLLNFERLQSLKKGALIINTSRGSVIDNDALRSVLQERSDLSVVLDVWANEPLLDRELASLVDIATPHIAGYSYDGKIKGTHMVYQAYCRFLGQKSAIGIGDVIEEEMEQGVDFKAIGDSGPLTALRIIRAIYLIMEDDMGLRSTLKKPQEERVAAFDQLRKHYRLRREFSTVILRHVDWMLESISESELRWLRAAGFCC